jgi:hypothetical protein
MDSKSISPLGRTIKNEPGGGVPAFDVVSAQWELALDVASPRL